MSRLGRQGRIGKLGRRIALTASVVVLFSPVFGSETLPEVDRVMVLQQPRPISDAVLTDQNGEDFGLSDLKGKVSLVFFGFTHCPDVCPIAMAKYKQLELSDSLTDSDINYVLISVDGERDSPEVLRSYLQQYSDQFLGLTGDPNIVRGIAKEFRASFYKESPESPSTNYQVTHSTQMFLLDSAGQLRAELHNPPVNSMMEIVRAFIEQ